MFKRRIHGVPNAKFLASAIIIQGDFTEEWTNNTISIMTERNPESLIIVSTYSTPPSRIATTRHKAEVDKGHLVFLFIGFPSTALFPQFWAKNFRNQNLQRLTSFMGVEFAKELQIPICLKIRSDAILGRPNVCKYLDELRDKYPPPFFRSCQEENIGKRMVTYEGARKPCYENREQGIGDYYIFDHWIFGDTNNLIKYFEITEAGGDISVDKCPETHLAQCWMKNQRIAKCSDGVSELCARFFIVTTRFEVEYVWQKYENLQEYLQHGYPPSTDNDDLNIVSPEHFGRKEWKAYIIKMAPEKSISREIGQLP